MSKEHDAFDVFISDVQLIVLKIIIFEIIGPEEILHRDCQTRYHILRVIDETGGGKNYFALSANNTPSSLLKNLVMPLACIQLMYD